MTQPSPIARAHMELPADRFFWAVLDAEGLAAQRGGQISNRLGFLFENALPVPIEDVHAVYQPIPGDQQRHVLACGVLKDELREVVANAQTELLTMTPASLPEFAKDLSVEPQALSLLTDDFQPRSVRRLKRQLLFRTVGVIAVMAVLIIIGLERRTASLRGQVDDAQSRRANLIASTLRDNLGHPPPTANPQPIDLRFVSELRTLRQTRQVPTTGDDGNNGHSQDATTSLAALLHAWPRDLNVLAESLSITPSAMTLRGQAPQHADVQALADALGSLAGWRLEQPQVTASGSPQHGVNAVLQWKRINQSRGEPS